MASGLPSHRMLLKWFGGYKEGCYSSECCQRIRERDMHDMSDGNGSWADANHSDALSRLTDSKCLSGALTNTRGGMALRCITEHSHWDIKVCSSYRYRAIRSSYMSHQIMAKGSAVLITVDWNDYCHIRGVLYTLSNHHEIYKLALHHLSSSYVQNGQREHGNVKVTRLNIVKNHEECPDCCNCFGHHVSRFYWNGHSTFRPRH